MTDVAAPSSFYLDLQIPSILRRRGGRVCPSPTPVPELAPNATPEARHRGQEGRDLDGEAAQLFQASAEPGVIERDELRTELVDLKSQISALRLERDELLAAAVSLNGEVSDLQSKQQELIFLRSEIQALRTRKSLLERPITSLRRPTERIRWGRTEFHDS